MRTSHLTRRVAGGCLRYLVLVAAGASGCSSLPRADVAPASGSASLASAAHPAGAITEDDLRARLFAVAHDSMMGRATGSPGHLRTVEYIAAEMRRLGLQPGGDDGTYFQDVPFVRRTLAVDRLEVDGQALRPGVDYVVVPVGARHPPVRGAAIVAGGTLGDTSSYITPAQAAGKVVLLRYSSGTGGLLFGAGNQMRWRGAAAVAIVGVGAVWPALTRQIGAQSANLTYRPEAAPGSAPDERPASLFLADAVAERLLGAPLASMNPGQAGRGTISGEWRLGDAPPEHPVRNVIAILPGSDPRLRGQYVALGAHSDHDGTGGRPVDHDSLHLVNAERRRRTLQLGRTPTRQEMGDFVLDLDSIRRIRPARTDTIFNGADDDGSGTVATLEIAEAMALAHAKPRRSVVFIWHAAEELGLIGANHWTRHPTLARDSIVAQLNMDMIGRGGPGEEIGGGPTYLQLIGWRRLSNELGDVIDAVNAERRQPFVFDLQYDAAGHPEQYYCRSDHYMYARYGIPVAFFSTGDHGDYHQVTDEPQYIDYAKLRSVTQFIHDVALRVANLDRPPRVDGRRPDPDGRCVQ